MERTTPQQNTTVKQYDNIESTAIAGKIHRFTSDSASGRRCVKNAGWGHAAKQPDVKINAGQFPCRGKGRGGGGGGGGRRKRRKRNRRKQRITQESCNSCTMHAGAPEHLAHLAHARPAAFRVTSHRLRHVAFHSGVLGCSFGGLNFCHATRRRDIMADVPWIEATAQVACATFFSRRHRNPVKSRRPPGFWCQNPGGLPATFSQ